MYRLHKQGIRVLVERPVHRTEFPEFEAFDAENDGMTACTKPRKHSALNVPQNRCSIIATAVWQARHVCIQIILIENYRAVGPAGAKVVCIYTLGVLRVS